MTGSIPTRIFMRDLFERTRTETQTAYQVVSAHLQRGGRDMAPQERAWMIGARAALGWCLGLPKTGKPIAVMLDGIVTRGAISLTPSDDWEQARRDALSGLSVGGFNTGGE